METQALGNNDFLETITPLGLAELLEGFSVVRERLESILDNMVEITTEAVNDRKVLRKGLEEAADVLERLNDGEGTMSKLLRDKALYGSVVSMVEDGRRTASVLEEAATRSLPLIEDLGETARNIQVSSEDFPEIVESASRLLEASSLAMENLGQLADELKSVSRSLPGIVESIKSTADNVEEASRELPAASRSIRTTASEAGRVVEAAKGSWLLKGSFSEGEETSPVEVDGR
jgi:ABC-type transporter Mla subunit MlaD